jgi:hypothetical protein
MFLSRILLGGLIICLFISSCNVFSKPKTGCPSNGKNVGAEVFLMEGQKTPKAKKFRN